MRRHAAAGNGARSLENAKRADIDWEPEKLRFGGQILICGRFSLLRTEPVPLRTFVCQKTPSLGHRFSDPGLRRDLSV